MAVEMDELLRKLDKVSGKLSKMKAIEEQSHILKMDNTYLQKKIARLERENEGMERKIEELNLLKEIPQDRESEIDFFPLHYSRDYDMRLENHEIDDQQSVVSKDEFPAEDQSTATKSISSSDSVKNSIQSMDDQEFDEVDLEDENDEYQLMTFGFVKKSSFPKKTYMFDPKAESKGAMFTEKIKDKLEAKAVKIEEPAAHDSAARDSASPVELPSSTVCRSTESDVCRLRNALDKVIVERNEFKSKYQDYKHKYQKRKKKLSKKSKHKDLKKSSGDHHARELKTDLKEANQRIKSFDAQIEKLRNRCDHLGEELNRKSCQCKAQQKEIAKFKEECKRLHFEMSQQEKSEMVLRRDVQALSDRLNMKSGVRDCQNCLKLERKCHELNDMYKRTLELLVFETSK